MSEPYSAGDRPAAEILRDFEAHRMDGTFGGSTTDYLHAAISTAAASAQERAAAAQRRWAKVTELAACASTLVAVVALLVAVLR